MSEFETRAKRTDWLETDIMIQAARRIHLIGIGGSGMSALAQVLHKLGRPVQGSDSGASKFTPALTALGITVMNQHAEENLSEVDLVIRSTAIREDNPEMRAARAGGIPVLHRSEALAMIMPRERSIVVAGAHGKTTTSSMIAGILDHAGGDPTVLVGGEMNLYGANGRAGDGKWFVVEGDESDGSFLTLPARIGVITNIDREHLDHYGGFDAALDAYGQFLEGLGDTGLAVVCGDDPHIRSLILRGVAPRVVTYGRDAGCDVRLAAERIASGVRRFDLVGAEGRSLRDVSLAAPGAHNALNAAAAALVALEIGIPQRDVIAGLARYAGVKRRFTRIGETDGVAVIDDYAHHPTEIAATIAAAREIGAGRILVVFEPHRYSRIRDVMDDIPAAFDDADLVFVDRIYAAGEPVDPMITPDLLAAAIEARGRTRARTAPQGRDALAALLKSEMQAGDQILCLGAGAVSAFAQILPDLLRRTTGIQAL